MLNTDLHNPNIKPERKMTEQQYIKMNRGIDEGGADVDRGVLVGIYNSIKDKEIVMKPELGAAGAAGGGGLLTPLVVDDEHWSSLLRSTSTGADGSSNSKITSTIASLATGRDMFELVWERLVRSLCSALQAALGGVSHASSAAGAGGGEVLGSLSSATGGIQAEERTLFKTLQGFRRVCDIAEAFHLPEVLNACLAYMCTALAGQISAVSNAIAGKGNKTNGSSEEDEQSGRQALPPRPGAAAVFQGVGKLVLQLIDSVFGLVHQHIDALQATAWRPLLDCVLRLNSGKLKLLPSGLVELDDFVDAHGTLPPPSWCLYSFSFPAAAFLWRWRVLTRMLASDDAQDARCRPPWLCSSSSPKPTIATPTRISRSSKSRSSP